MRATLRQTPSGLQIVVVCGTLNIEAARTWATQAAERGQCTVVIGIVRSSITKCWYVGLARQGDPLTWISAHRLKRDATRQIPLVLHAGQQGDLRDDAVWEQLLHDLAAQSEQAVGDPQADPAAVSRRPRVHWRSKERVLDEGT